MEEKYSIEEIKAIRTGIIALIAVLFVCFITISHNASIKSKDIGEGYRIYAHFGRTDGLGIGDAVRMAGVTIGRVVAADLDEHFNSRLTLEVDSKYKIPEDSSASIVSFGLIGGKYVEIEVGGSDEYINPGDSLSYTQDAMVLEELLDRIISLGKAKHSKNEKTELKEKDDSLKVESDSENQEIKGDEDE